MAYFLAVDAGGTKTDYLLADDTRILAATRSGSLKRLRVTEAAAEESLLTALAALQQRSGVAATQVAVTCIGAAGSSVPLVTDWLRDAFLRHVGGTLLLLEDVEIALDAAFAGGPGVLVLAGTGSNVAGRGADGHMTAAGGWGPALADHGSGFRLGYSALRETFLAIDEGRKTQLLPEVLAFWNLAGISDLIEKANQNPRPDFSELAALVGRCADAGDAAAKSVIHTEAKALTHLVDIIIDRIRLRDTSPLWTPSIAFTGSIMEHIPSMRQAVETLLHKAHPTASLLPGVITPAEGALWRARHT
jgi:glucosamine kinase